MPSQIPTQQPSTDKNKKGNEQQAKPEQGKPQQAQKPSNPANPVQRDTQFDKGNDKSQKQDMKDTSFEPFDARRKTQPIDLDSIDSVEGGGSDDESIAENPGAYKTAGTQAPGNGKIDRNTMSDQPGALRNKNSE
jgi:hypothetical protein